MATINFLYRSTKIKANLSLRLLYRFNEIDFVFGANTKLEVSKQYWSKEHKSKSKNIDVTNIQLAVNTELNKIENHILNAFNLTTTEDINKDWLQTQINLYYNPQQENEALPTELLKYFEYYIESKKNEVSKGTQKKYNVTKHLLERYQKNKKTIHILDVNENFKNDFENYCIKNNYAINTISKDIGIIKGVCNHAKYNGLNTSHQLEKIKAPKQKTEKIFLSFEDLTKIETIDKSKLTESLENTKDWLIISCYTGQRISDFMRFNKDMIRYENNKKGDLKPFIEFTQVKTDKLMTVALHPKVIDILNKRNGDFPYRISDQKYNDYIKVVCEIAKINEPTKGSKKIETAPKSKQYRKKTDVYPKYDLVTSHIGRRSFATNFYGTIPTTFLINVTGHGTETMFLNYIGKSNKDLAMELTNYF